MKIRYTDHTQTIKDPKGKEKKIGFSPIILGTFTFHFIQLISNLIRYKSFIGEGVSHEFTAQQRRKRNLLTGHNL